MLRTEIFAADIVDANRKNAGMQHGDLQNAIAEDLTARDSLCGSLCRLVDIDYGSLSNKE
jgi:hypothetical protein